MLHVMTEKGQRLGTFKTLADAYEWACMNTEEGTPCTVFVSPDLPPITVKHLDGHVWEYLRVRRQSWGVNDQIVRPEDGEDYVHVAEQMDRRRQVDAYRGERNLPYVKDKFKTTSLWSTLALSTGGLRVRNPDIGEGEET